MRYDVRTELDGSEIHGRGECVVNNQRNADVMGGLCENLNVKYGKSGI